MKKFLCAILFLTMVISLSACGGKGVSTLVKHYGQEKVDEMEIECTDETQLKVANDLIAEAKDIMSYCGSGDGTNKEDCGALERYYFFDDKAVRADVSIELVTTKQENGKGYIWVKLTVIKRSSVSLRIMVLRPTFKTGSLPQSTNFRMVFLPIPVHSAASSMVIPILTAFIISSSF